MTGAGAFALARLAQRPGWDWRRLLAPAAVIASVAAQVVLLNRADYLHWLQAVLIAGGAAAAVALLWGRGVAPYALAAALCLLLVAPTAYSTTTWREPVQGTFPAAGPHQATGAGGVGLYPPDVQRDRDLIAYVCRFGSHWHICVRSPKTGLQRVLTGHDSDSFAPTWSPDGTHLAFISDRDGVDQLFVMRSNGTAVVRLTSGQAEKDTPGWRP